MRGDSFHFGDSVTISGGTGNTGIVKNTAAPAAAPAMPPGLQETMRELVQLLQELREQVTTVNAQTIDNALTDISADSDADPQRRRQALLAVAHIAATVGAVGQPVGDAVNRILALLGLGQ